MTKKAFITGVTGQDGAYLAAFLLNKGYIVEGGVALNSNDYNYRLKVLGIHELIKLIPFNLNDIYNIINVVKLGQYDEIYNLAAQSFVGSSWSCPVQTSQVNSLGALHLLEAIRTHSPETKFYQASTSEMFGQVQEALQSETTPFYPRSPYGVSKLYAHWMTVNYRESYNLFTCSGILFNHESPLRGIDFVTKKVSRQMAEIKLGHRTTLKLGNLNAQRDWGYAKEYVVGMWKMLQHSNPDDYVLATGRTSTVRDFVSSTARALDLDIRWEGSGTSEIGIENQTNRVLVEVDKEYYRPAEVQVLLGNAEKAKKELRWSAKTQISELAELMAEFDYNEVKYQLN
jgi:GDPmannose 4,6-dehydratase